MSNPSIRDKEYLSMTEACRYLGISKTTLYKWRAKGLEVIKIEGRTLYSKRLIDDFMHKYKS